MGFQMSPQMACMRGCILTLIAFVWLFSTVYFQMSPQIVYTIGCVITLIAFVGLFSTVHFQMSPQIACTRGCIITLVAFLWLFTTLCFQMDSIIVKILIHNFKVSVLGQEWTLNVSIQYHCLPGTGSFYNLLIEWQKWKCVEKIVTSATFHLSSSKTEILALVPTPHCDDDNMMMSKTTNT